MIDLVHNCDYRQLAERMRRAGVAPDLCVTSPPYDHVRQRPMHGAATGIRDSKGRMIHEGDFLVHFKFESAIDLGYVHYDQRQAWFAVGHVRLAGVKHLEIEITWRLPDEPIKRLRHYDGYAFDPHEALMCIFETLAPGGTLCWNEGFSFTGNKQSPDAFRRPDQGAAIGFEYIQTLIYHKASGGGPVPKNPKVYLNSYEFVHVFRKPGPGPRVFNPLLDRKNKTKRSWAGGMKRDAKGRRTRHRSGPCGYQRRNLRHSVWEYATGNGNTTRHEEKKWLHTCEIEIGEPDMYGKRATRIGAPALMPWRLARDLIRTYAPTDRKPLIWDPFGGCGTVPAEAERLGYDWIMSDAAPGYCLIAEERISKCRGRS